MSTRSTPTEGRELPWCRLKRRWWHRRLSTTASGAVGGGRVAPWRLSILQGPNHLLISDLNNTTCPWPLKGTVADLAAFVCAGGALSCYYDSMGATGDNRAVGLATLYLRWRCGLSIYHDRFTCVCVWLYCAILFANVFYVYLSNKRFLILILIHCW